MFITRFVPECDITNKTYNPPVAGAAAIAQGATGRWCEVMWFGPEYIAEQGIKPISYEEAVAKCTEIGGEIDF